MKKYWKLLFSLVVVACATTGSYGIFKLMGYLDSMGNGTAEHLTINKYLFSTPIFLLFIPVAIKIQRKGIQKIITFPKNVIAASIAIYISIFLIGGMVSRTLFAKRAEFYGYTHCLAKNYANGLKATNRAKPVRPGYTLWLPEEGCKK
ncbi:MAG: hypothetical protein GY799_02785 [Desulfobulbaceae bacterium]|nr:hypothetical protein [Desulfobulbaceae bacterium]